MHRIHYSRSYYLWVASNFSWSSWVCSSYLSVASNWRNTVCDKSLHFWAWWMLVCNLWVTLTNWERINNYTGSGKLCTDWSFTQTTFVIFPWKGSQILSCFLYHDDRCNYKHKETFSHLDARCQKVLAGPGRTRLADQGVASKLLSLLSTNCWQEVYMKLHEMRGLTYLHTWIHTYMHDLSQDLPMCVQFMYLTLGHLII